MSDTLIICLALGIHATALITAIIALQGSLRGQYGKALYRCAWVPLCYAILMVCGTIADSFTNGDDFWMDMVLYIPLAALATIAGVTSFILLRKNKRIASAAEHSQQNVA